MSRRNQKIDPRQQAIDFTWEERVEAHLEEKARLLDGAHERRITRAPESWAEACIELAAACKRAQRQAGISREQLVDAVNAHFGWNPRAAEGKSLSIHMLNHYLSKPVDYPMPAALLFAIQHVTGSLDPCRILAEAEDGDVIEAGEKKALMLGKMESAVYEMQRLKRELRRGGGRQE